MIDKLRGIIIEKQPPPVLIEVGGIGYKVHMSVTCFYKLPGAGQEVIISTHSMTRESAQLLCGFNDRQERVSFKKLIRTNGVGPKLALAILSRMSAQQLVNVVERKEVGALMRLSSIDKKTAERLVVEMEGRFKGLHGNFFTLATDPILTSPASPAASDAEQKAVAILVALGYKPQEANRMVSKAARPDAGNKTLIREALHAVLQGKG